MRLLLGPRHVGHARPESGFLWTPAYWGWEGGHYRFYNGYWGPHVGFYGGINYGFGYGGVGFAGGYWNGTATSSTTRQSFASAAACTSPTSTTGRSS